MRRNIIKLFLLLAGVSLCLGLGLLVLSRPDSLPLPAKPAGAFRICAANPNYGNQRSSEVTRHLLSARPDILLLLEWTGANADPEALRHAGYRIVLDHPRQGPHGLALIVRDGIQAMTRLHDAPIFSPCRLPFAVARLRIDDRIHGGHPPAADGPSRLGPLGQPTTPGPSHHKPHGQPASVGPSPFGSLGQPTTERPSRFITVLGVHAPPPVPSCKGTNRPYLEALAAFVANGRLHEDLGPGRRGDPVLLAGDLNAMPWSRALSALRRAGLVEFLRRPGGRTLKPTWSPLPVIPSLIRIDHILAGPALKPLSAWTLDLPDSDHRAVLADLVLPPP